MPAAGNPCTAARSRSVVAVNQFPPGGQQFDLGPRGHHPLGGIEDIHRVCPVSSHHRDADTGPAVQIVGIGLGGGHREAPLQFGDDRAGSVSASP